MTEIEKARAAYQDARLRADAHGTRANFAALEGKARALVALLDKQPESPIWAASKARAERESSPLSQGEREIVRRVLVEMEGVVSTAGQQTLVGWRVALRAIAEGPGGET